MRPAAKPSRRDAERIATAERVAIGLGKDPEKAAAEAKANIAAGRGWAAKAAEDYAALTKALPSLDADAIRQKFAATVARAPEAELAAILKASGYHAKGGRAALAKQLLGVLIRKKTSQVQTSFIK